MSTRAGSEPGSTRHDLGLDLAVIWTVVEHDLPPLAAALERMAERSKP